jgi:diadenylate cyclase
MAQFTQAVFSYIGGAYSTLTAVDVVDICIIAVFVYSLISWLQKKTSRSIFMAVVPLLCVFTIAQLMHMKMTTRLLEMGLTAMAVALVVIFQEDFRRMFESLASWSLWLRDRQVAPKQLLIDVLVECFTTFGYSKTGALVVVKGLQSLEPHTRGGVPVNGTISAPLLYSIFDHHSPGHDGGVTVVNNHIERLGVHLPLSRNLAAVGRLGTRHTAALGLAERCDALVLCASEETGQISIAYQGKLDTIDSPEMLRIRLNAYVAVLNAGHSRLPEHWLRGMHKNWARKAVSVGLALGLWLLSARPADLVQQTVDVAVIYRNLPEEWEARAPFPEKVRVTLAGTEGNLSQVDASKLTASLDLVGVHEGVQQMTVRADSIPTPERVSVKGIEPREVTVQAFLTRVVQVPVQILWANGGARSTASSTMEVRPKTVAVRIRKFAEPPKFVETDKVDIAEVKAGIQVRLKAPRQAQLVDAKSPVLVLPAMISSAPQPAQPTPTPTDAVQ